jgi:hypothetical protein
MSVQSGVTTIHVSPCPNWWSQINTFICLRPTKLLYLFLLNDAASSSHYAESNDAMFNEY